MFKIKYPFMDENDGGDGNGGGGGGASTEEAVRKAVAEATASMNKKNAELLQELKDAKANAKQYEGLDIEKLTALQKHMEENEEAKLIADGKFDQVFDRKFQRVREDYDTKLNASNKRAEDNDQRANKFEQLYSHERIRNRAMRAAEKSGVLAEAIDDVVDKVLSRFKLNEQGDLEARDNVGSLVMSKDGQTVLQPEEYIAETVKIKHPYYWPNSRGAGLGGASGGGGGPSGDIDDSRMVDAAKTKNMAEFKRLRNKRMGRT